MRWWSQPMHTSTAPRWVSSTDIETEGMTFGGRVADTDRIDCPDHTTIPFEKSIRNRNDPRIRLRSSRRTTDIPRDLHFITLGIERAGGHIGTRRRAADTGKAVHHHRRLAVPCRDEIDEPLHVLVRRRRITVHRCRDVVDREHKMIFRSDVCWPLHTLDQPQEGHDVARSGLVDGGMQARQ